MNLFKNKNQLKKMFPIILIVGMLLGSIIGLIMKEDAIIFKPVGDIFLNLMYTIVVPLVFFTITSSIAKMDGTKKFGKIFISMLIVFLITSIIASLFMLIILLIINPVGNAHIILEKGQEIANINIGDRIVSALTVTDFSQLLSKSNMLPLLIFSILFGFSLNLIGEKAKVVIEGIDALSNVMMKMINLIMCYAPIGITAYFAGLIGEYGPELIGSYAKSTIIFYIVSIVYFFIFYTLYAYLAGKKKGIKRFYQNIFAPAITSLATQSSLATLPTNLSAAKEIGISDEVKNVTLPFGVTMHMEGSSMSAILKIIFLFIIFGKSFTGLDNYLIAILIAVLSGVVMSGIPGGGLIGEMLIVNLYGFPLSAFPIIATIGWLIDPPATCLNVVGDTTSSMLISRLIYGKKWLQEKSVVK